MKILAIIIMLSIQINESNRISKSATFTVQAPIDRAFPLFGPIREKEWAEGWDPLIVHGASEVEQHMVFTTSPSNREEEKFLWTITRYEPAKFFIEYTVSTPNRVWFISVDCKPEAKNTKVTVTYSYTALNERGARLNESALAKMFAHDLRDWEEAINYYIHHGKQLPTTQSH